MMSKFNNRSSQNKREGVAFRLVSAFISSKHRVQTLDMQNPGQWTAVSKVVFFTLLWLFVFALLWLLLISGKVTELTTARSQQQLLQQEYQQKLAQISRTEEQRKQLNQQQQQYALQLSKIPTEVAVANQIEWLTVLAQHTHTEVNDIALQSLIEQGDYLHQSVSMQVSGRYRQISEFLAGLQTLPNMVTAHDFEIKPTTERMADNLVNPNLQLRILLKTYSLNTEVSPMPSNTHDNQLDKPAFSNTVIEQATLPTNQQQGVNKDFGLAGQTQIFANAINPFAIPKPLLPLLSNKKQSQISSSNSQPIQPHSSTELTTKVATQQSAEVIQGADVKNASDSVSMQTSMIPEPARKQPDYVEPVALQFKGMVVAPSGTTFALLEQTDGRILQVKKGDYIGRDLMENNLGKVVAITANQLTLEETIISNGKQITRQRVVSIAQ